ncbi:MAG TPA: hypothetical protein GX700_09960 [Paracoccus sp.]|nr:hypothetical protein [Paracoccus sp. (in: a-proteobacteria)]
MRIVFRLFSLLFLIAPPLAVAGCMATPGWIYAGQTPVVVDVEGREYRVWSRRAGAGGQVQVVRMGYVPRSGHRGIQAAMILAAEQATGCIVARSSVAGDTGVINARIRC